MPQVTASLCDRVQPLHSRVDSFVRARQCHANEAVACLAIEHAWSHHDAQPGEPCHGIPRGFSGRRPQVESRVGVVDGQSKLLQRRNQPLAAAPVEVLLRQDMVGTALGLPTHRVEDAGAGDLVSRSTDDVAELSAAVTETVPTLSTSLFTVIATVTALFALDWQFLIIPVIVAHGSESPTGDWTPPAPQPTLRPSIRTPSGVGSGGVPRDPGPTAKSDLGLSPRRLRVVARGAGNAADRRPPTGDCSNSAACVRRPARHQGRPLVTNPDGGLARSSPNSRAF